MFFNLLKSFLKFKLLKFFIFLLKIVALLFKSEAKLGHIFRCNYLLLHSLVKAYRL